MVACLQSLHAIMSCQMNKGSDFARGMGRVMSVLLLATLSAATLTAAPPESGQETSSAPKVTVIPVNERQGGAILHEGVLARAATASPEIVISLSKQRVRLLLGGELAIDSPIASGRKEGWTPKGSFRILEKDPNHLSNRYGDLVDGEGKVIRKNVVRGATGGTFRGASMKWFLRLTWEGVGMHAGILPGYPASHGCIRLPRQVAERLYRIVPLGTPVQVTD
jgi:lipoprotein-anchoring transpeptidase ErfK/SrfK